MIKKPWFKAKWFGWGWYPSTWQGWTILLIWVVLFVQIFLKADRNSHSVSDALYGMIIPADLLFILLMFICWGTGERPRWRWGR